MTAYHCELAWLGGPQAVADVVVEVLDGVIVDVRAGVAAAPGAVQLAGLTLPGFANAHSHAFHRALRGRTHAGTGSFWTWREQMYRVAAQLTPATYAALATATYAEMALAGITAVGEFHYVHHDPTGASYADPNELAEVLIAAAAEAGVRISLLDTCYLHGGIGPDGTPVAPNEVQRRFSDGSADAWAARATALASAHRHDGRVRIGAAIHSVRAVDAEAMRVVASWAAEHDAPLHAHVSEQPAENEQCLAAYGLTPTARSSCSRAATCASTWLQPCAGRSPHSIRRAGARREPDARRRPDRPAGHQRPVTRRGPARARARLRRGHRGRPHRVRRASRCGRR